MPNLTCVLARIDDKHDAPRFFENVAPRIKKTFTDASDGAINLDIVDRTDEAPTHRPNSPLAGRHFALDLHRELRFYAANPLDQPVETVVALYGGVYHHNDSPYGMMFDPGFIPDAGELFLNKPHLEGRPREGCAIFLGAIERDRKVDPDLLWDQFEQQTTFTTIHELGHVFNLPHKKPPINYMSQSDRRSVYNPNFHEFIPEHETRLSRGKSSKSVWPGGSKFGDSGFLDDHSDCNWNTKSKMIDDLRFEISISRDHARYFEPFELDMRLRVKRGSTKTYRISDIVDPGYDQFRIFIEEPTGERRLYKSPRHYCPHEKFLTIGPSREFRRDISIFGESGGYTFRRAGVHRIWAEIHLGRRGVLTSNKIGIEIELERSESRKDQDVRIALTRMASANVLYHRLDRHHGNGTKTLVSLLESYADIPTAGAIQYSVGRALLEPSVRIQEKRKQRGMACFEEALKNPNQLSVRQIEIAEKCLGDATN